MIAVQSCWNLPDALGWINPHTPVEEAAHIAQSGSLPSDAFHWWRVSRDVNMPDPAKNGARLLAPIPSTKNPKPPFAGFLLP